jgi:hypothetical protein
MLLLIVALGLAAADRATARVDAVRVTGPTAVRVSGGLSDDVWRAATPVDCFVQREPHEGG